MFHIDTLQEHERMSTQALLTQIREAIGSGETDFEIEASGQHDIGGPLWHPAGKKLTFHVRNAGQRLGSMCLENTEIIAEGSVSADVGWLNAGGRIVVRGDAGDTAGHCAAGGTIYIGGRAGTRSGSLMKHDPLYEAPQLWILKNVGSFCFEFMGGGRAVVCGYDSDGFASVLGDRACVGMVGGVVYFRGQVEGYAEDLKVSALDAADIAYLDGNMDDFLNAIGRCELRELLTDWSAWKKLTPRCFEERSEKNQPDMEAYRLREWIEDGIFSDVCTDDFAVNGLVVRGLYRQRVPAWENAKYAAPCEFNCPAAIPTQRRFNLLREGRAEEAYRLVLEYTPFPGAVCGSVCPNLCMQECSRRELDEAIQIGALGRYSVDIAAPAPEKATGKKIAVVGGGVAGLNAAWQMARKGHAVTVYDENEKIGGKLELVIPRARLSQEILQKELRRIEALGVVFVHACRVDAEKFVRLRESYDAVIVATGGHEAKVFPWPGKERIVKGIDYLKAINRGERPTTGKDVIVIGCGNSGMDAAVGAYQMGAASVICIDVQRPAAFAKEIAHVESLGGKLIWPVVTKEITAEGIVTDDGKLIPGDMVIITVGETPVLDYLPDGVKKFREWLLPASDCSVLPGVFAAGDVVKPGRLVDAIAAGRDAAHAADLYVRGLQYQPENRRSRIPSSRLHKAYFEKCDRCKLPQASGDYSRCISCGTCRDCRMCINSCPEGAISRVDLPDGTYQYESDAEKCIGCGICVGVCPCGIWSIHPNPEKIKMYRTYDAQ